MLTSTILFKEKYCEISFDESNKILTAKWIGYLKPETIRAGCEKIVEATERHQVLNHISDQRELKVLSKECQQYLTDEWFPAVAKAGMKKIAILVSEDVFAQATVANVNTKAGNLQIASFHSIPQAHSFLLG